jgi:phosphoglycerate dehydrogenase-like enzyme
MAPETRFGLCAGRDTMETSPQMKPMTLLVVGNPAAPHLKLLDRLPDDTHVVVGKEPEIFEKSAAKADVLLNSNSSRDQVRAVWLMAPKLRWIHSLSAGVENLMFPELIASQIPLTNSRGVFARSLGEFVLGAALYFDKDFERMKRQQRGGRWEIFDVEELHGKTMGILGYGSIGRACAHLAHAFGMKVLALRRKPQQSDGDRLIDRVYPPEQMRELMSASDFVVVAAPLTETTRGMVGDAEIRAMKSTAIFINVGRGPVVNEPALIAALREKRIRGAALDVFDQEPLPDGHPFYSLENVLLSPHCADHTPGWIEGAVEFFLDNFDRFRNGKPLENIVDKQAGY